MDGYFEIEVYLIFEYSKTIMHTFVVSLLFPFLFYFCRCCLGVILMCYMNVYVYIYLSPDVAESQPIVSRDILTSKI